MLRDVDTGREITKTPALKPSLYLRGCRPEEFRDARAAIEAMTDAGMGENEIHTATVFLGVTGQVHSSSQFMKWPHTAN